MFRIIQNNVPQTLVKCIPVLKKMFMLRFYIYSELFKHINYFLDQGCTNVWKSLPEKATNAQSNELNKI
jgi:hypothetical protein